MRERGREVVCVSGEERKAEKGGGKLFDPFCLSPKTQDFINKES